MANKYEKATGYSPAQFNGLRAPVKAAGSWGGGSYTKDGRASEDKAPGYDKTCKYKVEHTTDRIK